MTEFQTSLVLKQCDQFGLQTFSFVRNSNGNSRVRIQLKILCSKLNQRLIAFGLKTQTTVQIPNSRLFGFRRNSFFGHSLFSVLLYKHNSI